MTGEITLRGRVLPIVGVKEKVLGAVRAGISTIVLPKENAADLDDLPRRAVVTRGTPRGRPGRSPDTGAARARFEVVTWCFDGEARRAQLLAKHN